MILPCVRIVGAAALLMSAVFVACDAGSDDKGDAQGADKLCGNKELDSGELCDTAIAAGEAGACPTECPADDPCVATVLAGSDCQTQCVDVLVTNAVSGDGCCPSGVSAADDDDCGFCGDGIVQPSETCDGSCATAEECSTPSACLTGQFSGSPEACDSKCVRNLIETCVSDDGCCPQGCDTATDSDCSGACGDGLVQAEQGETCEPGSSAMPCPTSCDDDVACTQDFASGSPANCNVTCTHVSIVDRVAGDGCCPDGANEQSDTDCGTEP